MLLEFGLALIPAAGNLSFSCTWQVKVHLFKEGQGTLWYLQLFSTECSWSVRHDFEVKSFAERMTGRSVCLHGLGKGTVKRLLRDR